jgi:hypothetical protein
LARRRPTWVLTVVSLTTRSSGGASLSRNALAPARRADRTYSSRSKVVRISTRTGSWTPPPARCRVASIPSMPGMRMSMRTTSARTWPASRTASPPSAASPTTSRSGSASRIIRNPVRISAVVHAVAVVLDPHVQDLAPVADADAGPGRAGVLERVGQRLLDDPVGRQVDPGRPRGRPRRPGRRCGAAPAAGAARPGPGGRSTRSGRGRSWPGRGWRPGCAGPPRPGPPSH